MPFSIGFLPDDSVGEDGSSEERAGLIELGNESEHFFARLGFWRESDYERQWRTALSRILSGADVSCLITSIADPQHSSGVIWWPLYRTGETIRAQNAIRFFRDLEVPFRVDDPYASVPQHRTVTEDGDPISEWTITVEEIRRFLNA